MTTGYRIAIRLGHLYNSATRHFRYIATDDHPGIMRFVVLLTVAWLYNVVPVVAGPPQTHGSFSVPDRGGQSNASSGTGETLRVGYGRIRADAGSSTPSGIAIFQFRDSDGVLISEAGVPAAVPVLEGRIFAEVNGPINTGLAIANPNDVPATVRFYFTDSHGVNSGNGSFELGAQQQTAKFLDQAPFKGGPSVLGTLTFTSSVPVAVVALRGFTNEVGEFLMTTLPVAPLSSTSLDPVYFPHFANGGGWATQVILVNPTDRTITGTVRFLGQGSDTAPAAPVVLTLEDDSAGSTFDYSIPPRSSQRFITANPPGGLAVGSVRATPHSGNAAPSGLVFFSFASDGKTVSEAGVPALPKGSAFRVYVETSGMPNQPGSIRSGLAITNAGATTNTVTLEVTRLDGSLAVPPATLALPPSGQIARFIDEIFTLPDNFSGVLRVTSTGDVAVVGLRLRVNERGELKVTTTAPSNETAASTTAETFFPHIADSGGWSTQFILFSGTAGQAAAGTLSFFDYTGQPLYLETPAGADNGSFVGQVQLACEDCGAFEDVNVVLTSAGVLETTTPNVYGQFGFFGLTAGDYIIQVRKPGFRSTPARSFGVEADGRVSTTDKTFFLYPLDSDTFVFHWEEDQSTAGYEYSAHINEPLEVEFLDEEVTRADSSSADQLFHDYNITLVDHGDNAWTHEHAYRLWQTMESIPQRKRNSYGVQSVPPSQWIIVSEHVADDTRIDTDTDGSRSVSVSVDAFVYATPRIARVDGKQGAYYSKRLHHAAVRFVTDNGNDADAYEKILQERFGVTTRITDHTTYRELTAATTDEAAWRFQEFHAEEIVQIINTLEEMPAGMHAIAGLKYLVRRLDGTPHPLYPGAPAVAWTGSGYIEFMEHAFNTSSILSVHRLIIHEKAHFLWAYLFGDQLKEDWIELGGWYPDANDPDGWSTTKQTEFVSAYAHRKNPNEDMAESIAYFVINPDKLRSRSPGKYEFVRDRIMQGSFYISKIREDLTFEVYNLYPDYVYPGKIRRVDIEVTGAPEEDKKVRIEIELHALDGELEGAVHAFTRIFSEIGTDTDLYLYPVGVPRGTPGTVLSGSFTLSKYAKAGYWSPDQIRLSDAHSNERFGGINDFGWRLYVNNPLEDVTPPQYVRNSLALSKSTAILEDREVQVIEATWKVVEEDSGIDDCAGDLVVEIPDASTYYRYGYSYGMGRDFPYRFDPEESLCRAWRIVPYYMPSGVYTVRSIRMRDRAGNGAKFEFRHPNNDPESEFFVDEAGAQIEMVTDNPDYEPPELDLNNISIEAQPTRPDDPNGETLVTLKYRVRDDISGVTNAHIYLRDPQGVEHHFHMYPKVGYLHGSTWFPSGDPSLWSDESWTVLLPAGSAPGIWGVAEIAVWDRAENFKRYDFTEIIHFDVEGQ